MKRKWKCSAVIVLMFCFLVGCTSQKETNNTYENIGSDETNSVATEIELTTETIDVDSTEITTESESIPIEETYTGDFEEPTENANSNGRYVNGYRLPDDNSGLFGGCGDDIRVINDIVIDCTNMNQTQLDNVYELCNAGYYTPVYNYDNVHYGGYNYNTVSMLIKKTDDSEAYRQQLAQAIEADGGYVNGGSGCNYGDGYDTDQGPYYIEVDYLTLEQQFCEVNLSTSSVGYIMNMDYLLQTYGVSEEVTWYCLDYPTSTFCDKSLGVWDEGKGTVTYNIYDVVKIYQATEEYWASDIAKIPSISNITLHSIEQKFPEEGGSAYAVYYLYMATDDATTLAELDEQLYQDVSEGNWVYFEYEERVYSYGMYQEGEVFVKELYFPELYDKQR